ncbi:MAG: hypothetical protein QME14_08785 [Methanobacteriaceae archaeon]|nr:hypothetical protein [Methanobacteriaceae archaeon]
MIIFVNTLSNTVVAHPGHGIYPEPVTSDDTSGSSGSSSGSSGSSGSSSGSSGSSGSSSGSSSDSSSTRTTSSGSNSGTSDSNDIGQSPSSSSQVEKSDSGIEPMENKSNDTYNSTSMETEDNSSWGGMALVGFLVVGLVAFGFLFKSGMLNR